MAVPAPTPIEELMAALNSIETLEIKASFKVPKIGDVETNYTCWLGGNSKQVRYLHLHVTKRQTPEPSIQGLMPDEALKHIATSYAGAVLDEDSIAFTIGKGKITRAKLKPMYVRAWYETAGLAIPSVNDLAEKAKAARAAKKATDEETVALLRSGPGGVATFNKRPVKKRAAYDCRGADLSGCDLTKVMLQGVNVEGADFSGSNLGQASFGHPYGSSGSVKKAKFVGANLAKAEFVMSHCQDADFSEIVAPKADFRGATLTRARFHKADLKGSKFGHANLRGADFTEAQLDNVEFHGASFDEDTRWPAGYTIPNGLKWKGKGPDPRRVATQAELVAAGPVDFAEFLQRLGSVSDKAKLDKAMAMLKAEKFSLFARVGSNHVVGVVKSQSSPDLVYSCRLDQSGKYSCCTQNLNVCGGLRGSPCKHILVLVIGLAKAGQLDPTTAHIWAQSSRGLKSELDRDAMAETFLQYKGAEAGEIDWRPTETIPEDFYTF